MLRVRWPSFLCPEELGRRLPDPSLRESMAGPSRPFQVIDLHGVFFAIVPAREVAPIKRTRLTKKRHGEPRADLPAGDSTLGARNRSCRTNCRYQQHLPSCIQPGGRIRLCCEATGAPDPGLGSKGGRFVVRRFISCCPSDYLPFESRRQGDKSRGFGGRAPKEPPSRAAVRARSARQRPPLLFASFARAVSPLPRRTTCTAGVS